MLIYTIQLNESQTLYFLTFREYVAYKKEHKIYPYGFTEKQNG